MILIAGLGNMGSKFNMTRHNIGFETVDYLAQKNNISLNKSTKTGVYGSGIISGKKVIIVKPTTYMNLSGQCIKEFKDYYDIEIEDVFIIYDDVDLPLGTLRIRSKGSAGSHNGMKNIIYCLNDDKFPRFRLGIGIEEKRDLKSYVLGRFNEEEIEIMKKTVMKASDAVQCALERGIDYSMNQYNERKKKESKDDEAL